MFGYGTVSRHVTGEIAEAVVDILGGGENALALIMETAQQETRLGAYKDPSAYGAGIGICQCDPIAFTDTRDRISPAVKAKIKQSFNIDVDQIIHRQLAYSPLLSFLWCRMHYLLRPGAIPSTIAGRADYWKKWYNSELGAGTPEEYIVNANDLPGLQYA